MRISTPIYRLLLKLLIRDRVIGNDRLSQHPDTIYVLEKPFTADRLILENRFKSLHSHYRPEQLTAVDNLNPEVLRQQIENLSALQRNEPDRAIRLQPIMVLAGHMPANGRSILPAALSESWASSGSALRGFKLLLNGRSTLIRIDEPLVLSDLIKPNLSDKEVARRAIWVLRTHFQRCRQAILGPDLSHHRTLKQQVIDAPDVSQAITEAALRQGISPVVMKQQLAEVLDKIMADFNPPTARIFNRLINFLLGRLFSRIRVHDIEQLQQLALTHNLVYLPCHRSHLDYILLSWLLYRHGLMVPHVVAGDNLDMPIIGNLLRRGGAIFMRRRFRDDPLYTSVFKRYMILMMHRGHSIEYFIEGGRSRSGRLLSPKTGLLKMTLEAWSQDTTRPIALIPVAISYDRLVEGRSYQRELSGASKVRENVLTSLKSLRIIFKRYGEVGISFAQPIKLEKHSATPPGLQANHLAQLVMERINDAFMPSQISLIASLLLSAPRQQMREADLLLRLQELSQLLETSGIKLPQSPATSWIKSASQRQQITRGQNAVALSSEQAAELTFYRNMLMHRLILPGLVLLFQRRLHKSGSSTQTRLLRALYPYIRAELSLPDPSQDQDLLLIRNTRQILIQQQLMSIENETPHPLSAHLIRLAEPLLLRQYLLIRVLVQLQQASELELLETTRELALHLHQEYGYAAPEYADRRVFEDITTQLLSQGLILGEANQLRPAHQLNNLIRLGKKLLPDSLISKADNWLKKA